MKLNQKQVYISGALTKFNRKDLYEAIGKVVNNLGFYAYVPHLHIDGEKNVTSKEIYDTDMEAVEASCLVIAYVGYPSLGVGAELERANSLNIPVILMYEKNGIASDFVQGMSAVKGEIEYEDETSALKSLEEEIKKLAP